MHLYLKHGRPNHKIEIIDAGDKTLLECAGIVTQLFDVDPWSLSVMRTDLAVDVEGVSVPWFKDHAYVSRKQFSSSIEKSFERELQIISMGSAFAQTLYAGKRPCLLRIYNKLAEWRLQLRKMEIQYRRFNDRMVGMDMSEEQRYYGRLIAPTFTEFCSVRGYELHDDSILTRIERQIGGNRIPPELATLGDLRNAHDFHPFSGVRIVCTEPVQNIDSTGSIRSRLACLLRIRDPKGAGWYAISPLNCAQAWKWKWKADSRLSCRIFPNEASTPNDGGDSRIV